jgi:hypothetical protein
MRFFAVHDAEGKIEQAVMCPTDAPAPVLQTGPGLTFTEVEPPEGLTEDGDLREFIKSPAPVLETAPSVAFTEAESPESRREDADLREFMKNHRVDVARQQKSSAVRLETPEAY